ncbi:sensor histidine kinase [Granulicella tundricola]|uniref:histidine kinase n=1 Tax=Granulicella tundricola (strain ATCC BAA-1859 / DSM 23138 / MP5ACTX9) TaxID=1198114 RepID=E8X6N6_GRATM|nr:HAMP domain-containing sensor histidine kinase [Granulicella tundricola]ADW71186.1 integral membrane sensor signal transduction histidine kinase [Granulicella tundricola MP5ACTX9]
MKAYSLTRRLITAILLVELCSTLILVTSAGIYEGISRFRAFDIMLRGRADSMLGAVQDAEDPQDNVMLDGTQSFAPQRDIYAVRDELGRLLGHSHNWPDAESAFNSSHSGFSSLKIAGRSYRVIRVEGLRMVDPGDKGGGIPRHVVILYGARTHPLWESIEHTIAFYALLSLILLATSGLIMLRLLRRGLSPLTDLAAHAAQVSVDSWHFHPSDTVRAVQELAPLANALETVLARLERSFEQQRHFVSDAAHELKTSVAVIKSTLQLLVMKNRTAEEYREGLKRAEADSERMEQLVAAMLTLAGLEATNTLSTSRSHADLTEILAEVTQHFQSISEASGITITLHAPTHVTVIGDREKIRLLCSNLIHNALQHSPPGAEIRAIVTSAPQATQLRIEDDGEGIASEALPHVFERFYRGDVSRSRKTGGTGLGLAISKAIVQELHGAIAIESTIAQGTRVIVDLPHSLTV